MDAVQRRIEKAVREFTDNDLTEIEGNHDKVVGKGQERYGDKKSDLMKWRRHGMRSRRLMPRENIIPLHEGDIGAASELTLQESSLERELKGLWPSLLSVKSTQLGPCQGLHITQTQAQHPI
jgi:uncharacterized protein YjbJ (UPF0337 family)